MPSLAQILVGLVCPVGSEPRSSDKWDVMVHGRIRNSYRVYHLHGSNDSAEAPRLSHKGAHRSPMEKPWMVISTLYGNSLKMSGIQYRSSIEVSAEADAKVVHTWQETQSGQVVSRESFHRRMSTRQPCWNCSRVSQGRYISSSTLQCTSQRPHDYPNDRH